MGAAEKSNCAMISNFRMERSAKLVIKHNSHTKSLKAKNDACRNLF
jgi:hypothetical protein